MSHVAKKDKLVRRFDLIYLITVQPTATCVPALITLYREVAALQRYVDCNALVPLWARKAGCFVEVAAEHSNHLRQVPL